MKILYVEDNDDNVYMLKNRLSRAGFTVVVATNGARGIAMAGSEQPDLILMDLTLPDIRGEEAGKPWYRRRALRVFRDDTSLSATPGLWTTIEQALGRSRFFVLLASPDAAASKWVNKEVALWLDHNSTDTLLIGVTDGELSWDEATDDFAVRDNMPLPPVLSGRFVTEPKWVDLRPYRGGADKSDAKFTELAADFAAAIRGMPKEDLLSQEVRQQRRALTLAWSAAASLLLATGAAAWEWRAAVISERYAVSEAARAERNFSAGKSTIDSVMVDFVAVELAASLSTLGDLLRVQGDITGSLEATRESLDIRRTLVAKEPNNNILRSDLCLSLNYFGDALRAQGDLENALTAYRDSLDISRALVAQNSTNSEWQRLLSIGLERIGVALSARKNFADALFAFRETLDIARELNSKDPDNMEWRSDLAASLEYIGDTLRAQGDVAGAAAAYREGLGIRRELAAKDPSHSKRQTNVVLLLVRLAATDGDPRERLREALTILIPLREKGRLEPAQQEWIAAIEKWIAIKESEAALLTQTGVGHFNASSQATNAPTMMNKLGVVQLYPANNQANAAGILEGKFVTRSTSNGLVNVRLPDGEWLAGEYAFVQGGTAEFGSIYASVHDNSAKTDERGSRGTASLSGDKGTSMQCEFYNDTVTGHGRGGCRTSRGALFRLQY